MITEERIAALEAALRDMQDALDKSEAKVALLMDECKAALAAGLPRTDNPAPQAKAPQDLPADGLSCGSVSFRPAKSGRLEMQDFLTFYPKCKPVINTGQATLEIAYTNWRGETSVRRITPLFIWWGSTEYPEEPQWMLTAFDEDKGEERDFAMKDFKYPSQIEAANAGDALYDCPSDFSRKQVLPHERPAQNVTATAAFIGPLLLRAEGQPLTMQDAVRQDAARDVLAERDRQIGDEGWTPAHDDEHSGGQLAAAAAAYAFSAFLGGSFRPFAADPIGFWPWDAHWFKPSTPRRDLVKAGALILAEIERLDRHALRAIAEAEGQA